MPHEKPSDRRAIDWVQIIETALTAPGNIPEELPPVQLPEWDVDTALEKLGITKVPFRKNDSHIQGYAHGREIAINPFAVHQSNALFHELGHVVFGHTTPEMLEQYEQHRGIFEFQASVWCS